MPLRRFGPRSWHGTSSYFSDVVEAGHDLLKALAVVLCAAALTSILSRRLRQPAVLGYIVAGLLVGPHVPVPLVADPQIVHTLSELGVILLMFSLGLEFSLQKLVKVGPAVGVTAVMESSILFWLGFAIGRLFGWTTLESLFAGGAIAISSTTIIVKAYEERQVAGRLRELVIGVLVVEDLIAVVLMATLTAIASGAGLSPVSFAQTVARLGAFLVALVVGGLFVVPRAMRALVRAHRPEVTAVASVGLCFGLALLGRELGYSVALGAFIAGSLVAESGEERKIEHLVKPLRDVFGAVFFVSVGMMMDPAVIVRHWAPVLVLTLVVVIGKTLSVSLGAFVTGNGVRTSIQTGMSFGQIGEFSFIIAGLGLSLGATGGHLFPIAIAVSSLTTLLTPWLIRASEPAATWVDRKLPGPLQTFGALYGSWLERIRKSESRSEAGRRVRRLARLLVVDAAVIAAIVVAAALGSTSIRAVLVEKGRLPPELARVVLIAGAALVSAPFCIGLVRVSRRFGAALAEMALPVAHEGPDLALAPRRALVVTLQLASLLLLGAPVVALTQPFLRGFQGAELLLLGVLVLGVILWRSAADLHGHVRAGAEVVVELLARQTQSQRDVARHASLTAILDGLGEPLAIELLPGAPSVGKTLADLNLRGLTGATVLAITRDEVAMLAPSSREPLRVGDVLVVAGTRDAVEAARAALNG